MTKYQNLFKKINIEIQDAEILNQAFTHRSVLNETPNSQHNERIEFLGDAVLELATTEFLFKNYKEPEGILTNYRSALVKRETLATVAKELDLGTLLHLSKGEERSGGREKDYLLANTLEALIGAIYLTKGYTTAESFIKKWIISHLPEIIKSESHVDPKSNFQEIAQAQQGTTPHYKVISQSGKDHNKTFTLGAYLNKNKVGEGQGKSKREAESKAAEDAIKNKKNWKKI